VTQPPPEHLLRRLARVNPATAFFVAVVLLLAGFFLPGIVGAAVLTLLGAGLGALTFTTWPVQRPATRAARLGLLAVLIAAVVAKVL
jgi:hypothetical protein